MSSTIDYKKLYEESQLENKKLEKELFELQKVSNTKTNLIENLFIKIVKDSDMDDGISLSKDYGHKYIDEWNIMYHKLLDDVIKTINECELDEDNVYLQFHPYDYNNIEYCIKEEDEEDEEEEDETDDEDDEDEDEDNNINSLMEFLVMNNITEITINDESLQELRDERQELQNKLNEAKQEHIDLVSEFNKLKSECDE